MISEEDILNARILIVDDNKANVILLEKTLAVAGYTSVLSVTDSREAADIYKEFMPNLVLLDINMPFLDGYQVMEQFKAAEGNAYIPVLVLTAQNDRETLLHALKSGARDFLTKPFDHTEALTRIHNMLEVRLLHSQVRDQNSILEQKVRERTKELDETRIEVIRRLGQAAEYRDNETGSHIIRMSLMSSLLGRSIGMSDYQADLLLNASPMHDVGKIGIPDRILLKPSKLDPNEWEIMKTHTIIGEKLLDGHPSDLMVTARTIALTHHEKWDGSGYPNGLKGEKIPLTGKICAVCDVFDALTSDRPYKKAWSLEDAIAEIDRGRGMHFEPRLVDSFHKILDGIFSIKKEYS